MRSAALTLTLGFCLVAFAHAHNVIATAWTVGDEIEGEIGFSSGELAPEGTVVRVLAADGTELGQTKVDADGLFRFKPTTAVAHRFVVNLGQGHVAQVELAVDELPTSLAQAAEPAAATTIGGLEQTSVLDAAELERVVTLAVQRELASLRRDLARQEEKASFQSIIAGLGYIAGIFGLLFFIYARQRQD